MDRCSTNLLVAASALTVLASCSTAPPRLYESRELMAFRAGTTPVLQEEQDAEALAKQLANPIAALVSLPFQFNNDNNIGPQDGTKNFINVQPVIPVDLNDDWVVISRTILPIVSQSDVPGPGVDETGLGDTVQSLFFSPKAPTDSGWIWGAGPVFLVPTATDETLGGEKWGIGPTAVALKQSGPWTYGGLVNHIVSVAGDDGRPDVNATFLQPFVNYTTPTAWSYIANVEYTYDWENEASLLPMHLLVGKVTRIGGQLVQFTGGLRIWVDSPDYGPEGVGFRLMVTPLFPR